jgi:hypothetical protein
MPIIVRNPKVSSDSRRDRWAARSNWVAGSRRASSLHEAQLAHQQRDAEGERLRLIVAAQRLSPEHLREDADAVVLQSLLLGRDLAQHEAVRGVSRAIGEDRNNLGTSENGTASRGGHRGQERVFDEWIIFHDREVPDP